MSAFGKSFREEVETLINMHNKESGSDTPDFILAEYLDGCLAHFDQAVNARDKWYGREPKELPIELVARPDILNMFDFIAKEQEGVTEVKGPVEFLSKCETCEVVPGSHECEDCQGA